MIAIFIPACVLMLVTALVWLNMFLRRALSLKSQGLDVQNYPTPEALNAVLSERVQAPANCYRNLLEVPTIFYALTAFVAISQTADIIFLNMAWGYVGLRALQAMVHCSYNRVMHRFYAYFASCLILWLMVIRFFLTII